VGSFLKRKEDIIKNNKVEKLRGRIVPKFTEKFAIFDSEPEKLQ
jgi:hypothetical protein